MMEESSKDLARINIEADKNAASNWHLTTHFGDKKFAESGAHWAVLSIIKKNYIGKDPIDVIGVGSGTALYEQEVCKLLKEKGIETNVLLTNDLQMASLRSVSQGPKVYPPTIPIQADITMLPISNASPDSKPRLVLSRALEQYFSDNELTALLKETARVLNPGDLYVTQLSSGDESTLPGVAQVINIISGKFYRYFSTGQYVAFISNIKNRSKEALFTVSSEAIGEAIPYQHNAVSLVRRYLNYHSLPPNLEAIRRSGVSLPTLEQEIDQLSALEKSLSDKIQRGEIKREVASAQLDATIYRTKVFSVFRSIIFDTVQQFLNEEKVITGDDLKIFTNDEGDKDIQITFRYPVITLTRTKASLT